MAVTIQIEDMDGYATGRSSGEPPDIGSGHPSRKEGSMISARLERASRLIALMAMVFVLFAGMIAPSAADDSVADLPAAAGIVGDWLVESRDAVIRIERVGDEYQGTILWQLHDTYGPEDGPDLNGKIVTDRNNPDPAQRSQPLTGLRLLKGLHYDVVDNKWIGGRVYNSENGKTYNCVVRLPQPGRLVLRGYIGLPLLGGNTTWTRVTMKPPGQGGVPYVIDK
jgi:uncharacterized protein (DUF2147 family)